MSVLPEKSRYFRAGLGGGGAAALLAPRLVRLCPLYVELLLSQYKCPEGTPLYELHRYERPQTVGFFGRFGHKQGIDFGHFGHN